ncbi:MAG: IS21 family transposase [candidate division NC10 bacterium]
MRKLSEVLRLSLEQKVSVRKIARSCCLARSTVSDYLGRAKVAGLGWPLPEGMDEDLLERLLFPVRETSLPRPALDMAYLRNEMRKQSVTLQLLWEEYRSHTSDGYSYSQFCQLYGDWVGKQAISLRQEHRAGEKLFVDFAGDTIPIHDPRTGEISQGHVFVGVLGCSNHTYAEVTATEKLPDWIGAQVHALEDIKGVPLVVVPDNTKAAVRSPCWYDPDINLTYQEMAEYYGFTVIPARVRKPKDKAKVENGVLIAERWILARLRHHTFFSIAEANEAVRKLLIGMNAKPFKKLPGSRQSVLEAMERPTLKPLPECPYEFAEWKQVAVNIDYHVDVEGHYYSAPYQLIQQRLMARITRHGVELLHKGKRVAAHTRSHQKGRHTTLTEHQPPAHQKYLEWTPERLISWAGMIGPNCAEVIRQILASRPLVVHGYRPCLGVIRLGKPYGNERLERACARALKLNIATYHRIENLLKTGRDKVTMPEPDIPCPVTIHNNVRGAGYYQ